MSPLRSLYTLAREMSKGTAIQCPKSQVLDLIPDLIPDTDYRSTQSGHVSQTSIYTILLFLFHQPNTRYHKQWPARSCNITYKLRLRFIKGIDYHSVQNQETIITLKQNSCKIGQVVLFLFIVVLDYTTILTAEVISGCGASLCLCSLTTG